MASPPQGGLAAVVAALRGCAVAVATSDGGAAEGVLSCAPGPDSVCLRAVLATGADGRPQTLDALVVPLSSMVSLQTLGAAELGEAAGASSGGFATDAEIAGGASCGAGRTLQPWGGSDDGLPPGVALEDSAGDPAGQGSWDQFGANARLFGVHATFDEAQYTTPLDRRAPEYARRAAEAGRIAREIERASPSGSGGARANVHLAEERGHVFDDSQVDEEDRYGAVVRPAPARAPVFSYRQAALSSVSGSTSGTVSGSGSPQSAASPVLSTGACGPSSGPVAPLDEKTSGAVKTGSAEATAGGVDATAGSGDATAGFAQSKPAGKAPEAAKAEAKPGIGADDKPAVKKTLNPNAAAYTPAFDVGAAPFYPDASAYAPHAGPYGSQYGQPYGGYAAPYYPPSAYYVAPQQPPAAGASAQPQMDAGYYVPAYYGGQPHGGAFRPHARQ